jgi:hypothetical protein
VYRDDFGHAYRIGYYIPQDGLQAIWLVNHKGDYIGTTARSDISKYFAVEFLSEETDYFGTHRRVLGPMRSLARASRTYLPPLTLLQLIRAARLQNLRLIPDQVGQFFQIGYYTPNDGLELVWIVDEVGTYLGTIPRALLRKYFRICKISGETNYSGVKGVPSLPKRLRLEAKRMALMLGKIRK